jgi:hypothetical protein
LTPWADGIYHVPWTGDRNELMKHEVLSWTSRTIGSFPGTLASSSNSSISQCPIHKMRETVPSLGDLERLCTEVHWATEGKTFPFIGGWFQY